MPRPRIGDHPMTPAERKRRQRANFGAKLVDWQVPTVAEMAQHLALRPRIARVSVRAFAKAIRDLSDDDGSPAGDN